MNVEPSNSEQGSPAEQPRRGRRYFLLRLAVVFTGILPFILLEIGLRCFDIGRPSQESDPLAGFNQQHPVFEQAGEVFRTARSRQPFFSPQEFAAVKPTNGFRVFSFGGSTVYGHPYQSDTAFSKWLQLELTGSAPGRRVEVVNCGGVSYASYRLAPVVREVLHYQPDLVVLAMGHNEFLEDRTYVEVKARSGFRRWIEDRFFSLRTTSCLLKLGRLLRGTTPAKSGNEPSVTTTPEVQPRLDDALSGYASYHRDDRWHRLVTNQFEASFQTMIEDCRAAGVPVLIVTLGSNLRDCPPFKSEHKEGLSTEQEYQWQSIFDLATTTEAKDMKAALAGYHKAEAIDDQYALLSYRIARCLDRTGQTATARDYYLRAKDQDICPLRMLDQVYQIQKRIASQTGTPYVNARELLEELCPGGIPGNDLYLDHVHPSIGAHQVIAQAMASKIGEWLLKGEAKPWSAEARLEVYRKHFAGLDPNYFTNGRRRVMWLDSWARRQRLLEETLPKTSSEFLREGMRQFDLGELDKARGLFRLSALQDDQAVVQLNRFVQSLDQQGRPEAGRELQQWLEKWKKKP
jgi:lysophospholipase L1-like esterase